VYSASWDTLTADQQANVDISLPLGGISFGVLIISVLGVLVIASEYSTGMIRTSLTALPRRSILLGAKLTVSTGLCLVIGLIVSFTSYAVAAPFYSAKGVRLPLTASDNLRAVVFAGLYLALVAMLGFAIGALLRHTAGAISTILGIMFVLPIITSLLPGKVGRGLNKVMPANAGNAMMMTYSNNTARYLSPVDGLLALVITVAVLCAAAFALFKKRDA
jgi:ABC-2 type transport system permease protein